MTSRARSEMSFDNAFRTTRRHTTTWLRRILPTGLLAAVLAGSLGTPAFAAAPANDDFAAAEPLPTALPVSITGTNGDATEEPGEPDHVGNAGGASVWYRWAPATSEAVTIDLCGSGFDTLLAVYTGDSIDTLTAVTANDDGTTGCPSTLDSAVTLEAEAGTTYWIAVDGYDGQRGSIQLAIARAHPVNDDFGSAIVLDGSLPSVVAGSTVGATLEAGEPLDGFAVPHGSIWYRWTPVEDGLVSVTSCDSDFETSVLVYTGTELTALTAVGPPNVRCAGRAATTFVAVGGTTYSIRVDGVGGARGLVVLEVDLADPPANDAFGGAVRLPSFLPVAVPGTNVDATHEPGEPSVTPAQRASVWYRWQPEADGLVRIATCGGEGFSQLAVYVGSVVEALVPVVSDPQPCEAGDALLLDARGGVDYAISVDAFLQGAFDLTIAPAALPANDTFADARVLPPAGGTVVIDSNVGASTEPGEPAHGVDLDGATLWYRWTPVRSGDVRIDACGSGALWIQLAVYSGASIDGLTPLAADEDSCASLREGAVALPVTAGTEYRIAVDTRFGQGPIELDLHWSRAAANDDFADARRLGARLPIRVTGSTVDATDEPGEPHVFDEVVGDDSSVWYGWTPESSGSVALDACNAELAVLLGVFTGSGVDALEPVPAEQHMCNEGPASAAWRIDVAAGTTYWIRASGHAFETVAAGTFPLTIRAPRPPANDAFASARVLMGTLPIVARGSNVDATAEPDEPDHDVFFSVGPASSVWYRWTATRSERIVVDVCGAVFHAHVSVWVGDSLTTLSRRPDGVPTGFWGGSCQQQRLEFDAVAGTTYRIAVSGRVGAWGSFDLAIRRPDRPTNDDVVDAQPLTGRLPIAVVADNADATTEQPGEFLSGNTVWYQWTAPSGDPVVIDGCDSSRPVQLAVFTGTRVDQLVPVGQPINPCFGRSWALTPTPGTTYRIQVDTLADSHWDDGGSLPFQIRRPAAPANDDFAAAQAIRLTGAPSVVVEGDNEDATAEPGEPASFGERTVWYRFTAAESRVVTIDTCGLADRDVAVQAFTGATVDHLVSIARGGSGSCGVSVDGTRIAFHTVARTTYSIAVDVSGGVGPFELRVR